LTWGSESVLIGFAALIRVKRPGGELESCARHDDVGRHRLISSLRLTPCNARCNVATPRCATTPSCRDRSMPVSRYSGDSDVSWPGRAHGDILWAGLGPTPRLPGQNGTAGPGGTGPAIGPGLWYRDARSPPRPAGGEPEPASLPVTRSASDSEPATDPWPTVAQSYGPALCGWARSDSGLPRLGLGKGPSLDRLD
jgi:hypothetical protein